MKKIFSLVALAGIFALMSFSFKFEKKETNFKAEKVQPTWCDSVDSACTDAADSTMTDHDYTMWEACCYYLDCITMNGC